MHFILGVFFSIYIKKKKKKRKEGKGSTLCSYTILSVLKTRLVNLFSHDMSYVSFFWCLSLCLNLEVTYYLTVGLKPFEKEPSHHCSLANYEYLSAYHKTLYSRKCSTCTKKKKNIR